MQAPSAYTNYKESWGIFGSTLYAEKKNFKVQKVQLFRGQISTQASCPRLHYFLLIFAEIYLCSFIPPSAFLFHIWMFPKKSICGLSTSPRPEWTEHPRLSYTAYQLKPLPAFLRISRTASPIHVQYSIWRKVTRKLGSTAYSGCRTLTALWRSQAKKYCCNLYLKAGRE